MSFAKEVWDKFSKLDVNKHTDKRGQFTFLSWTWAWDALMKEYPESTYEYGDAVQVAESLEVRVTVTVKSGEDELSRAMWLPVMDFHNKSIPMANVTTRDVSDARMRCLVKCLAMFGLGHYIYAGEDLPSKPVEPKPAPKKPVGKLATAEQKKALSKYKEDGDMSPRRVEWCKKNWRTMTVKNANEIIKECNELKESK